MNNKFQVLTNIYVCTGYFIFHRIYFLENVLLLVKTTSLFDSFEFIKVSIIRTFWLLLENWCSSNTFARKRRRPVLLEELQAASIVQTFSLQIPPEAVGEDWSQSVTEILWCNLVSMWWSSYYTQFGSEIWRWLGNILLGVYHFSYDFLVFFKCYDFTVL